MTRETRRVPTRRDAVANRARLLSGAERYFATHGVDAPLHGLASHVGVGIGTLYRNFPDHEELIRALHDRVADRYEQIVVEANSHPRGSDGVTSFITNCVAMLLEHPASADVTLRQAANDSSYRPLSEWNGVIESFLDRAKHEGSVRRLITAEDLAALPFALSSRAAKAVTTELDEERHRESALRFAYLTLDGLNPCNEGIPVARVSLEPSRSLS